MLPLGLVSTKPFPVRGHNFVEIITVSVNHAPPGMRDIVHRHKITLLQQLKDFGLHLKRQFIKRHFNTWPTDGNLEVV